MSVENSERMNRIKKLREEFEKKYIDVLSCQTNLPNIPEGIKDFFRSVVILEANCIEDCENMAYPFPLKVVVTEDNSIVVKCCDCEKEYKSKDTEKLIKESEKTKNANKNK
jgi:hypothetical protein